MEAFFDHEKLEIYRVARQFSRELRILLEQIPRGHSESKDNLSRAAKSMTRCIAEGAGRWRVPDKIRFYHIARGSATECAAGLDELVDWHLVSDSEVARAKSTLARVVAMLISMIRSMEARQRNDMSAE